MASYEFTEPALKQFQQLETWLGEETLDELETIVRTEQFVGLKSPTGLVRDLVRIRERMAYYVFLTFVPDEATGDIRVTAIGVYSKPSAK